MADEVKGPAAVYVQVTGKGKDARYRVIARGATRASLVTSDRKEAMAAAKEAADGGAVVVEPIETTTGPVPGSKGDD